jgi:nucleoside phosphorylase
MRRRSEAGRQAPKSARPRGPKASDGAKPRPDLVLVTVNEHETKAVHDAFLIATGAEGVPVPLEGRLYHDLGTINGTTVYHAISEMGSGGPGAMQQAVDQAIRALDPGAVVAIGIAFGVSEAEQAIGDILLSRQRVPRERDPKAIAAWLESDWPRIQKRPGGRGHPSP